MPTRVLPVLIVAGLLALPASASAATRYAAAAGAGTACTQAAPCPILEAIQNASDNDTVVLAPDEYDLTGIRLDVNQNNLTIRGAGPVGDDRTHIPYLMFNDDDPLSTLGYRLVLIGTNPVLRNLGVTGQGTNALVSAQSAARLRADRVIVNNFDPSGPPTGGIALAADGATITNSIVRNQSASPFSRALEATGSVTGSLAYASTGSAISLARNFHPADYCTLTARNTIAWGGGANLKLDAAGGGVGICSGVTIDYDYSWIPLSSGPETGGGLVSTSGGGVLTPGTHNLAETPAAVDPLNPGSSTLPANSPAINAGCTAGCGTTDYFGRPRPIGPANDIGPYEASLAPTPSRVTAREVTATSATLTATVNPNYAAGSYVFQVRKAGSSAWRSLGRASLPLGNRARTVTGGARALQPSTAYQARVTATNPIGSALGAATSFRTPASLTVSSPRSKVTGAGAYITSRVKVSGAGQISQRATTGSSRRKTRCQAGRRAGGAGSFTLKCNLGRAGRRALRKSSLKLTLRTTFTPASGSPVRSDRKLTVKRKR